MITLALTGLEAALNKVLSFDLEALKKLAELDGKSIKINITDWDITFFILPYAQGMQLLTTYYQAPSTTIAGKLFDLMKVGAAGASTTALFDASMTISGDTTTGEAIRDILRKLDIDWEEQLSKIVGDYLAHPIASQIKQAMNCAKRSIKSLSENITEYLHYEAQQLPTKKSVEHFIEQVATLRDDIERSQARIQHLHARKDRV